MRSWEGEYLWDRATPSYPAIRREPEPDSPIRTPFQRDRDRIVHSKAFRRLKHKTQVFIAPEGDHYRTRLTHTLETCGIARTVARALGLNEDLDRGDRPGPRPRPPAVRPHRRGGARPGAARARRAELPAQPPVASGRGRAGARRAGAQPDRGGARRDPQPHGLASSRRPSRGGWCGWSTGSPTSTTTSTTRCGRGSSRPEDLPAAEIELLGPSGREADRHARAGHRRAVARGGRHRPERGGRRRRCCGCASSCSSASIWAPRRGASTSACSGPCGGCSTTTPSTPRRSPTGAAGADELQRITDYIAGMTDRFCIATFKRLALPGGVEALIGGRFTHRDGRAGQGGGRHRRDRLGATRTCGAGASATRACARSTRSARRRSRSTRGRSSTTASGARRGATCSSSSRRRRGSASPRRWRRSPTATGSSWSARARIPRAEEARRRRARLGELLERTAQFYATLPVGVARRRRRRASTWSRAGLGEEVLRAFGVGYAPSAWDQVLTRGQRAGFERRRAGGRGAGPEGAEGRPLRPLPRPDHVPGARRAGAGAGVRGAGASRRTRSRST